ncbi:MAG TPA: hypothetical protein VNK96_03420 [Fimbriimonadales bacterium]|nr:hypothetical protein [Fimbriimonadales bacterium]
MFGFALGVLLFSSGFQQVDINIYNGTPISQNGLKLSPWGSGSIEDSGDVSLIGGRSLKIVTTNFYQGGLIELPNPISLAEASKSPENLLGLSVYVIGVAPGGESKVRQMENVRLVLKTTDGKLSEVILPIASGTTYTDRWRRVGIPLQKIPGFSKTNQILSAIYISGDGRSTFYVGEIRVLTDQTPIQGSLPFRELNLGRGQEVQLYATAEAGYSILEYVWDFDARDGLQEEAIGQVIYRKFRIPGEFTITCTIRDMFGLKQPWTGTITVVVNP